MKRRFYHIFTLVFIINHGLCSQPSYKTLSHPAGSNSDSSFVELLLIMDSALLLSHNQDIEQINQRLRLMAAHLNHAMQPLNVYVYLSGRFVVDVSATFNITSDDTAKSALGKFSKYIVESKNKFGIFDHAMLITGSQFRNENGDVQTSFLGGICWLDSSLSIITEHYPADDIREVVMAMAYALGRNLGIEDDYHDRIHDCLCFKRPCAMSSYQQRMPFVEWSSCSKDFFHRAQLLGRHYCLKNSPRMQLTAVQPKSKGFDSTNSERQAKYTRRNGNGLFARESSLDTSEVLIKGDSVEQESTFVVFPSSQPSLVGSGENIVVPVVTEPRHHAANSRCGNGFVEIGEECDCGLPEFCSTAEMSCCDPFTCKLTQNASCAAGECCDLSTCSFKPKGFNCRKAVGECDLPEFCFGDSEHCPADVHRQSGAPCSRNAHCHEGLCRSLDLQCKRIFGETAFAATAGFWYSNMPPLASYDFGCGNGVPCANDSDVECGRLFCQHESEKPVLFYAPPHWRQDLAQSGSGVQHMAAKDLQIEDNSASNLSLFVTHRTESRPGNRAIREASYVVVNPMPGASDPGYVDDGTPCGSIAGGHSQGVCLNHVCVFDRPKFGCSDSETCNNHGVCNSLGGCHCDIGYSPPYCNISGNGGSLQSGPLPVHFLASSDSSTSSTALALIMILLSIVFLALTVLAIIFRRKLQIWYYSKVWGAAKTSENRRFPNILSREGIIRVNLIKVQRKWAKSQNSTPAKEEQSPKEQTVASEASMKHIPPRRSFRGLEISTPVLKHTTRRDLDSLMPLNNLGSIHSSGLETHSELEATSPMLTSDPEVRSSDIEDYEHLRQQNEVPECSPDIIQSTYHPSMQNGDIAISSPTDECVMPTRPAPKTPQHNRSALQLRVSMSVPERLSKQREQRDSTHSDNV